jgi:hypothetical protein
VFPVPHSFIEPLPVAKFLVPDWGDVVYSGIGLSYDPPGHVGWRAGTTSWSRLYSPMEFGFIYSIFRGHRHEDNVSTGTHNGRHFAYCHFKKLTIRVLLTLVRDRVAHRGR